MELLNKPGHFINTLRRFPPARSWSGSWQPQGKTIPTQLELMVRLIVDIYIYIHTFKHIKSSSCLYYLIFVSYLVQGGYIYIYRIGRVYQLTE